MSLFTVVLKYQFFYLKITQGLKVFKISTFRLANSKWEAKLPFWGQSKAKSLKVVVEKRLQTFGFALSFVDEK